MRLTIDSSNSTMTLLYFHTVFYYNNPHLLNPSKGPSPFYRGKQRIDKHKKTLFTDPGQDTTSSNNKNPEVWIVLN